MSVILPYRGKAPRIHESAWIAPNATVTGDVEIGPDCSVWFGTVIRGDVHWVRIGARVNVQDLSMIHVTTDRFGTLVEDDVTIGHAVKLHGCTLRRACLIGIGAIVLDQADIGEESLIGAGSVVTPGTRIPSGVLAVGNPCKVRRDLTDEERAGLRVSAAHYVRVTAGYKDP